MAYTGSEDLTLRKWEVNNKGVHPLKAKHALSGHSGSILTILPLGRILLSGSTDCSIILWQEDKKMTLRQFNSPVEEIEPCEESQQLLVR